MSPALAHGKVDQWLLDHEEWIAAGGAARLALCEDWRKVAVEFGAGHPAAVGCLLALVRDAWSDPYIVTVVGAGWSWVERPRCREVAAKPFYSTELEALVAALEAALKRGGA
jgi:hypothetical protein